MDAPNMASKCVLIIDDNPLNLKLFSAIVAAQGYGILQAADGLRGIDLAHRECPDLIVMDVMMPGISGLEATRQLKQDPETKDIPIIVTSGYVSPEDDEELRACGAEAFIAKPIGVSEFLELIELVMLRSERRSRIVRRVTERTPEAKPERPE